MVCESIVDGRNHFHWDFEWIALALLKKTLSLLFYWNFNSIAQVIAFIKLVQALLDAITIIGIFGAIGGAIYAVFLAYYTVCLKVSS